MTPIKHYMQDGANYQSRAVLAFLQNHDGIEESWNDEQRRYVAEPEVARWENCREQGYVVSLRGANYRQLNIVWFEHRNSDNICAIKWEQNTLNCAIKWEQNTLNVPTIGTAEFEDVYKTKWDVSYELPYGKVAEMADWIWQQLVEFWVETNKEGR